MSLVPLATHAFSWEWASKPSCAPLTPVFRCSLTGGTSHLSYLLNVTSAPNILTRFWGLVFGLVWAQMWGLVRLPAICVRATANLLKFTDSSSYNGEIFSAKLKTNISAQSFCLGTPSSACLLLLWKFQDQCLDSFFWKSVSIIFM